MRLPFELTLSECRLCVCRFLSVYADLNIEHCSIKKNAGHGFRKIIVNSPLNVWSSLNGLKIVPWLNSSIKILGKQFFLTGEI